MVFFILEEMNLEFVEIEYVKEGKDWFLCVFIDFDIGVDIEDCGVVSEKLSEKMDVVDLIFYNYFLEVLLFGVECLLKKDKDFECVIGKYVYIKIYELIEGVKEFEGEL